MVVHRVVSAVGYVQRVLRFRSDLMGIENVEVPVDRFRWSIRGHAPFRRVIDRPVDAARSSRSPSRDVRATP